MAWRQIGAMPFLGAMLISNKLEREEQLSVQYVALFAHFHCQKVKFIRHIFLKFQNFGDVYELVCYFLQVVGPSDGSYYVIDYYGAALHQVHRDNLTHIQPQYEYEYEYNYEL